MGPTNVALVRLFLADQQLRVAQAKLDAATKDVRIQERRVNDLTQKQQSSQHAVRESQAKAANMELDLKMRDQKIEQLRTQQQNAHNNKEYQTLLLQINTFKVDRNKVEDETMKLLEQSEKSQQELKALSEQLTAEQQKLDEMKAAINDKIIELQAEIDATQPARDEAAANVQPRALQTFERLAEHHDGEAMAPIAKPDRRREEYLCTGCNMDLVADIYNKLHTRDDLIFCPSCQRILYIPDDLPPEVAVHKSKPKKPAKKKGPIAAAPARGESAMDVLNSMRGEEEEAESAEPMEPTEPQPQASDPATNPSEPSQQG